MNNAIPIVITATAATALTCIACDSRLITRKYNIVGSESTPKMRFALISDLHSCDYGEEMSELVNAVDLQAPDFVVMTGDIFDKHTSDENSMCFLERISEKYKCFYVTGNHEYYLGEEIFTERADFLDSIGIKRLSGENIIIEKDGKFINICGIDDPNAGKNFDEANCDTYDLFLSQLEKLKAETSNGNFTVLLSHRPEWFDKYAEYNFDLVLCGHAHGGQVRLPYIMNGLLAPHQGVFPKLAGGEYKKGKTTMLVSRGLARRNVIIPRVFNRPELVIVDIV